MPATKAAAGGGKRCRRVPERGTQEYYERRERNNVAVKKSRQKTRQKATTMLMRVEKLRAENVALEKQVEILTKELSVLRDLFKAAHTGSFVDNIFDIKEERKLSLSEEEGSLPSEDNEVEFTSDDDSIFFGKVRCRNASGENELAYVKGAVDTGEIIALDHKYSAVNLGIQLA